MVDDTSENPGAAESHAPPVTTVSPAPYDARLAPAPWQRIPSVVEEVEDLHRRFTADDLCVPTVLCDCHDPEAVAFTLVDGNMNVDTLTYGRLADSSRRLASALAERGVTRGTTVGVLMAKTYQLPIVALALWRLGAVYIPLFTAFAGPAIAQRVERGDASLVIADPDQLPKLDGIDVPTLESGSIIDELVAGSDPIDHDESVGGDGLFLQLYTSGTTGAPKGVGVPAFAIGAFIAYMRYGFDVQSDDMFWNVADPGWAYGLYYAIVGPLALGHANILLSAGFSSDLTARIITELGVDNLAAAPTVYRALKRDGIRFEDPLRVASSAGEPLTPDVTSWAKGALGTDVYDHWGQTEHGMGIINAWDERLRREPKVGSMGQAMPGFVAGIVDGNIALSNNQSPLLWFRGYVNDPERSAERCTDDGEWYLTGDDGRVDGDDFFFASRDDDVILAAGYRISPFDLESIIVTDDAVAEAAVIGRPDSDSVSGEVIEAYVTLNPGASTDGLTERLQEAVRSNYGRHAYPRRVHVIDELPKTPSGKVQRFILRQQEP